jgi:hypothetical protein
MSAVRRYPYRDGDDATAPDYGRVVRTLTDEEIEEEILGRRGEPGYQLALLAEAERRGKEETGD